MAGLRGCATALLLALGLIALIAQPAAAASHQSSGERCGSRAQRAARRPPPPLTRPHTPTRPPPRIDAAALMHRPPPPHNRIARAAEDGDGGDGGATECEDPAWRKSSLRLIKELPFIGLFSDLKEQTKFEASGITSANGSFYVVFDSIRSLARLDDRSAARPASRRALRARARGASRARSCGKTGTPGTPPAAGARRPRACPPPLPRSGAATQVRLQPPHQQADRRRGRRVAV